jgi:glycosyltransferase involved in cell wall biosynthesis
MDMAISEVSKLMKVTVAIPTYNRAFYLNQTLEGLMQQDYDHTQLEIIVIDNNSTDKTEAIVNAHINSKITLRYIKEIRQGLDYARNCAVEAATGEIIIFGDDDILVKPDWVSQMTLPFLKDKENKIGALGGEVIPVFPEGLPSWIKEWHSPLNFRPDLGPIDSKACPMGANLAFPKRVFSELGLFSTTLDRSAGNYFSGGDSEMVRRVRSAGLEVWFAPDAAVEHQMPSSRTTFKYASKHAFDSARSRVIDRSNQPGKIIYLITRLSANLVKAVIVFILGTLCLILFKQGTAKKYWVRSWRSCGYVYQSVRSLLGIKHQS